MTKKRTLNKSHLLDMRLFLEILKISRPGLWFATVWLYLLPTGGKEDLIFSPMFWLGLFYVCFPLNLLVYGWNDIVDYEADRLNPRKGNYLFGALSSKEDLSVLPKYIFFSQLLTYPIFIFFFGMKMIIILIIQLIIMYAYNHPTKGLRSRPPFELTCQIGYLLIVPLSAWINSASIPPNGTLIYLMLFAFQSHLIGEVMDIEPDRLANKTTTATVLGMFKTKLIIIAIVLIEVLMVFYIFNDSIFGLMLLAGLIWLIIDLFFVFKTKTYTLFQMKLLGWASNIIAFASMSYVWWSQCLL